MKRVAILAFVSLTYLFTAAPILAEADASARTVKISLREAVALDAGQIAIRDVAEITGPDAAKSEIIGSLTIGATPWPGNIRRVTRRDLGVVLARQQTALAEVAFAGAEVCSVTVRSVRVSGEEIAEAARRFLLALPALQVGEVTATLQQTPQDRLVAARDGQPTLEVGGDELDRPWGTVRLRVNIRTGGYVHATMPVFFNVTCARMAVVAARNLSRDETIGLDAVDLRLIVIGAGREPENYFFDIEQALGKRVTHNIVAGAPITTAAAENPLAVRKGEIVSIIVASDNLRIIAKGAAQRDARIGELVPVAVLISGKMLTCTVTGQGIVSTSL